MRVIIPSAGKGTSLQSSAHHLPKAMHLACGQPLLQTVLEQTCFIAPEDTYIVVGYRKDEVISYSGDRYHYIEQKEQLGTGHAVMVCEEAFAGYDGTVLVTFGDMPLFRRSVLEAMCRFHEAQQASCTLLTAENPDLTLWARVIRDEKGKFQNIVEGKNCTDGQLAKAGQKVVTFLDDDGDDLRGVNTLEDLRVCEEIMRRRGMGKM